MEASAARSSGKGLLAPSMKGVIFIFGVGTVIDFPVTTFETSSTQMTRDAHCHVLSFALHRRRWSNFLDDVVELVVCNTSLELIKT